jgi:hypothetical protein
MKKIQNPKCDYLSRYRKTFDKVQNQSVIEIFNDTGIDETTGHNKRHMKIQYLATYFVGENMKIFFVLL